MMSYALIPIGVMALPLVLAIEGSSLSDSSWGFGRIGATVDAIKFGVFLALALTGIGWIIMGYLTAESLLNRLEKRGIIKHNDIPEIRWTATTALDDVRKP